MSQTTNNIAISPRPHTIGLYSSAFLLLLVAFWFDGALLGQSSDLRFGWLDGLMLFLTDFGLLFLLVISVFWLWLKGNSRSLFSLIISGAAAVQTTMLFKLLFQTPRPYLDVQNLAAPLTKASGFAFPSLHATVCFILLFHLCSASSRIVKISLFFLIFTVAYSRIYLGVHYFTDVLAGAMIGLAAAQIFAYCNRRWQLYERFILHYRDQLELRRQIFHLLLSLSIVFLLRLQVINGSILLIITILGGLLSLWHRYRPISGLEYFLSRFERPEHSKSFPGKGAFFLLLGSSLAALLFESSIALAAISIMGVGDSISHLIGRFFGKTTSKLTGDKKLEGTAVAIICATFTAIYFVDFWPALIASVICMSLEAIYPPKLAAKIDDNLLITLFAGLIIWSLNNSYFPLT